MRFSAAYPRWSRLGVALLVLASGLRPTATAAASKPGEPLVLEIPVFSGGLGTGFLTRTARAFEQLQDGVVRIELYGDPRMNDKMRIRALDGSFPDATFCDLPWVELARAGKLVDLTAELDGPNWEGDGTWRDTFLPGVLDTWTINGRTYGIPLEQSCWTLFYNKRLFREHGWSPPRTWDDFFALCEKIHAAGLAPVALPGNSPHYGDPFFRAAFYNLAGANGWRDYNNFAPGARSDPRFIRAADVFQQIARDHLVPGWAGMTHTAVQLAFLQGRAAFVVSGSWFVQEMSNTMPPDFELGAMNFPVFADGVADPTAVHASNGYFFAFTKDDPARVKLTLDFLRFLTSRERAQAFARELDAPVAVRGIGRELFSANMQDTAAMLEGARTFYTSPPNMLLPPGYGQSLVDARLALIKGSITPQEFGEQLESAAAAARLRRETNPHEVVYRYPVRGSLFLVLLAAAFAWTGWGMWQRLRGQAHARTPPRVARDGGIRGLDVSASAESRTNRPAAMAWFGPLRLKLAAPFVWPSLVLFAAVVLVPGLTSFWWSLDDWDGINPRSWAGLFNFKWLLFESEVFWRSLGNNLFLMLAPTAVVVPVALIFAALISRGVAGAKLFRACFLFPNILGGVAASLIWLNAYDPTNGFINSALTEVGQQLQHLTGAWWLPEWLLGFEHHAWLRQGGWSLYWALIPIYVWLMVGFNLVLYLAAMEGIDSQYYEAAELDGASKTTQFFRITLPMIREVIVISAVFIVIGGLNTFEMIWLLTGQQPNTGSHVLATWMVSTMFQDFQIGRATAIAVVMFLLVLAGSAVTLLSTRREAVAE